MVNFTLNNFVIAEFLFKSVLSSIFSVITMKFLHLDSTVNIPKGKKMGNGLLIKAFQKHSKIKQRKISEYPLTLWMP